MPLRAARPGLARSMLVVVPTRWLLALVPALIGCAHGVVDDSETVTIAAGEFQMGSTRHERALALEYTARVGQDLRAAALGVQQELPRHRARTGAYYIMVHPVTQDEYAAYAYATGAAEPWVDPHTWARTPKRAGEDAAKLAWSRGRPQPSRREQPVVLVSQPEAEAYCAWWGRGRGGFGSLPSEAQWERAARGDDGHSYPWGTRFEAELANTRESGATDLEAVGRRARSGSPFGVQDVAGNAAEWTRSVVDGQAVVKGGAWSDAAWAARGAARRRVPALMRHASVGFRCVLEPPASPRR